ncbi:metalloregulator ArsR/SmtB family transcription factor [Lentibacter algarum]|uniref:ArsR/SmtB family transcription factor n=1 Tax=Lentibacter algarum TaxID=576131 RepID=UPI001C0A0EC6|nr:helix-turn-helix transcriptional regulator [Lentibacter algarum]MBU2983384.1 metalloregulator ArsR/SmtB family transcription factor [Lentibacter algarum]
MITDENLDSVFHALAHASRRKILDLVKETPGLAVGELAAHFDVSRIAIMNHLTVLERAGLILSEKDGRARRLTLNVMPIAEIHARWTDSYSAFWSDRTVMIKQIAETAAAAAAKGNKGRDNE